MNRFSACVLAALAAALAPAAASAQAFPAKPMRIIVPFTPGSILDTIARFVAARASEDLGQPAVVENRGGAGGRIGAEQVAKSPPDGYTILLGSVGTHVGVVFLSKVVPYDPVRDFTPISLAVEPVSGLVANPSLPVGNMKELIEYSKKNPGKVAYATNGVGTVFHVAGELLKHAGHFEMLHVPMQGAGDVTNALVGGHVQVAFASAAQFSYVTSGKMKLLGMTTATRYARLPNVPTLLEQVPGFDYPGSWLGFFGPANLPPAILTRWNAEVVRGLTAPEVRPKLEDSGMIVVAGSPQQFAETIRQNMETFGRAVKLAGIQPE